MTAGENVAGKPLRRGAAFMPLRVETAEMVERSQALGIAAMKRTEGPGSSVAGLKTCDAPVPHHCQWLELEVQIDQEVPGIARLARASVN